MRYRFFKYNCIDRSPSCYVITRVLGSVQGSERPNDYVNDGTRAPSYVSERAMRSKGVNGTSSQ